MKRGAGLGVRIDNRLPANQPRRAAVDAAINDALAGLPGPWDVRIDVSRGRSCTIEIVAPDGSYWAMTCATPDHEVPEFIAESVRTACRRRVQCLEGRRKSMPKRTRKPPAARTRLGVRSS